MKIPYLLLVESLRRHCSRSFRTLVFLLAMAAVVSPGLLQAQTDPAKNLDPQTVQVLLQRIDQLEARVRQLEAASPQTSRAPAASEVAAAQTPASTMPGGPQNPPVPPASEHGQATPPAEHEAEPTEHAEAERMDLSKTLLRIRGFGDVNLHGDNQKGNTTSFSLGQLNLFVTSDISDKFKFLSEIVFEAGPDNIYGNTEGVRNLFTVDIERYLVQYSYNDYFNLAAGRYHTAIGYYNTAYHHSTWLQTTTGRPLLFEFEDRGGILPIHNVGVEASGRIPSGSLGLHYVAEIGNGRESRVPLQNEPVQNELDDNNHKALNFAIFARPTKVPGLQAGFSVYRDLLTPATGPAVNQTILAAHVVYTGARFEWLNEALVIRDTPTGVGHVFETPGFYSQISRRFGSYRPYFRYQYENASPNEPIFPNIALRAGPSAGVRFDASESVALKLQYDFIALRNQPAAQGLNLQLGFTF